MCQDLQAHRHSINIVLHGLPRALVQTSSDPRNAGRRSLGHWFPKPQEPYKQGYDGGMPMAHFRKLRRHVLGRTRDGTPPPQLLSPLAWMGHTCVSHFTREESV